MKPNILMFSIGLNGYDIIYSKCIKSQKRYAQKNSYDHLIVNRPNWVNTANDASWLKIPLILEGFRKGYEWFFYRRRL